MQDLSAVCGYAQVVTTVQCTYIYIALTAVWHILPCRYL